MTHLVVFKSSEGRQAYHQSAELDDALRFIEHLKNTEAVEKAKLFKLSEIALEYKTVVRVEVAEAGRDAGVEAVAAEVEPGGIVADSDGEADDGAGEGAGEGDGDVVPSGGGREPAAAGGRRRFNR